MKKVSILFSLIVMVAGMVAFAPPAEKYVSTNTHIKFFSTTPVEDIEANNYTAISSINPATGDVIFSVPMQGFEFEKALMQKHFNQDKFLDTRQFPRASLKGKITNIDKINFEKDGKYEADVEGELTIRGVTNSIKEKGTITVKGSTVEVGSKFDVTLADYGITFVKGKPSSNIAKTVEVTIRAEYQPE
jgi:polyisoprenoid-binding protein YceI